MLFAIVPKEVYIHNNAVLFLRKMNKFCTANLPWYMPCQIILLVAQ